MSKKTILLFLKSPLQSWGFESLYEVRTTFSHPTKSGVIGIISASMGIDKYAKSAIGKTAQLAEIEFESYEVKSYFIYDKKRKNVSYLSDFHTVAGGYSVDNKNHTGFMLRKASGKIGANNGSSVAMLTRRHYIQDSCFIALVRCDDVLADDIAKSLQDPKWGIWLGRKACIPSIPVFGGVFDSKQVALDEAIEKLRKSQPLKDFKLSSVLKEKTSFEDTQHSIFDVPIDFRNRKFNSRGVSTESLT